MPCRRPHTSGSRVRNACPNTRPAEGLLRVAVLVTALPVAAALLFASSGVAAAQERATDRPDADPADVSSVDAIIAAGYEVVSGGPGEARDWDRFRSLFHPAARLLVTFRQEGEPAFQALTVEEFIAVAEQSFVREGMYEEAIHTVTERYGDIAHVWATDASRRTPGAEPFERGINSFQLWHDGERWWVTSLMLHAELEGRPIPERYGG